MNPKRIGIVGTDGVAALHLAGALDALLAAALDDGYGGRLPCYEVYSLGLTKEPFRTESGMMFMPQESLEHAPELDTIIVPGGRAWNHADAAAKVAPWLLKRMSQTRRIAAVCTGVYAVAATGLLDGREVTVHWRFATDLARRFPRLRIDHKKPLVKDGAFYTASGITAGINLSLALIEEDYGPHVARAVAREVTLQLQNAPAEPQQAGSNEPIDRFGDLVGWMVRNLHADLSVEALARRACMSPDHFSRAFKSVFGTPPSEFVENLRLNEAKRRLVTPGKTLNSVAASVGFTRPAAFSNAFKRRFGVRPSSFVGSKAAHETAAAA
jgi:transcriptional regulator GlxA family with amidase domain